MICWSRPPADWIKVNVDAATLLQVTVMGFGMIARDADGYFLKAKSLSVPGCFDSMTTELIGIQEALSWVKDVG